ncbi:MAG TPA: PQQ-binding-like beta-propeller repeat protein [Planctomycetaceae bacterium]|nr:PQQ-binding-like beta-propeller repeat protein [Planctomycetaceae bacterium]
MWHPTCAAMIAATLTSLTFADTGNWPQYRGAESDGLARGDTLPDTWSTTDNVVWKAEIPGWGWSSPVIWDDRIFVTSAVGEQELDRPVVGGYPGGRVQPDDVHRWVTFCLDFDTGRILWEREAHEGVPPQQRHPRNSFASETPITDGERVYAYFANIGLFCYDLDGNKVWEQRWPSYPMRGGWGTGASPVLHEDRIYVVNDNETESFMVALDKHTGRQIWRVARDEKSNWSTPYVWEHDDRTEIVTIGTGKVRSNALDGNLLWELTGTSGLVSLMPLSKHGLLYVGAGYHYGPLYAIRPGASGDISLGPGESSNEWIAWSQPRGAGIHPCFLISGERLFVLFDAGLLTCYNALTGETIFPRQRLNTGGGRFYASPWAYNGNVFLLNEDGTTWVIEDGPEFKLLRKNSLDDNAWATPAVARGSLFLRTYTGLYRLQQMTAVDVDQGT